MIERRIIDAYTTRSGGADHWVILTANPDGTLHTYIIPEVTFDNLIAEYGFDPGDIDTLLRVAMLQLHIPPPTADPAADAAAAAGYLHHGRPVTLDNAASTAQARDAHLARIAHVETTMVRITTPAPGPDPAPGPGAAAARTGTVTATTPGVHRLAALKASWRPDPGRIAARRAELAHTLGRPI